MVAMLSVSQIGRPSLVMYSQRGGVARSQMSPAMRGASQTKNQVVEAEIRCQHSANSATPSSQPN